MVSDWLFHDGGYQSSGGQSAAGKNADLGARFHRSLLERMIADIDVLPIIVEIAALAAKPSLPQAKLFDRLIVSTAIKHQLVLIARDRAITASGLVETLW